MGLQIISKDIQNQGVERLPVSKVGTDDMIAGLMVCRRADEGSAVERDNHSSETEQRYELESWR